MPRIGAPTRPIISLFFAHDDALVGGIGLSNVRRGVSETASLGYWIGEPYARQGYMTAALPLVLDFAFDRLRLHRVEAACLPTNMPSRALCCAPAFSRKATPGNISASTANGRTICCSRSCSKTRAAVSEHRADKLSNAA